MSSSVVANTHISELGNLRKNLIAIFAVAACFGITKLIALAYGQYYPDDPTGRLILGSIVILSTISFATYTLDKTGIIKFELIGAKFTWKLIIFCIVGSFVIRILAAFFMMDKALLNDSYVAEMKSLFFSDGVIAQIAIIISMALIAPIIEELAFRHLLVSGFISMGWKYAVCAFLISTILFTFAHQQYSGLLQFSQVVIMALFLVVGRWVSGGMLTSIICHSFVNTIACIGLYAI